MSDAADPIPAGDATQTAAQSATRRRLLTRFAAIVLVIALGVLGWYVVIGSRMISTDDAYIGAETAQVTPLITGTVTAVHVRDTDVVKAGTVLVELDPIDAKIAVAEAEADLASARRHFAQARATGTALAAQTNAREADIRQISAQIAAARATAEKARLDLARREALAPSGGVSGEELSNARRDKATADAALASAEAQLTQARASRASAAGQFAANDALVSGLTEDTDPSVRAAKARLEAAKLNLDRTIIRAPLDGVVSQRQVQLGQRVNQGTMIMAIVPVNHLYVEANFKERQLARVHAGMPAKVTVDIYGDSVVFHGRVEGIAGATGAATAIIPAQNATGNWIKVVQRLPVRIALDPDELAKHPLRVGLSTEVTINLDDS